MEQNNIFKTAEQMKIETLENLVKLEDDEIFKVFRQIQKVSEQGEFSCYWGTMFPKTKKILTELGYKLIKSYSGGSFFDGALEVKEEECYDISWENAREA